MSMILRKEEWGELRSVLKKYCIPYTTHYCTNPDGSDDFYADIFPVYVPDYFGVSDKRSSIETICGRQLERE